MSLVRRLRSAALPTAALLVAFLALPVRTLGGLTNAPGDLQDGRLNAYFLENAFQFLTGGAKSLWHLGIFTPYPYTLGFSDNLFGAFPVYLLGRVLTGNPGYAFDIWWYGGWIANFAAAYVALRWLSLREIGATVGALIFAFALPVTGFSFNWAQLDYRFGLPLAVATWLLFLREKRWSLLLASAGWLVWQFFCTIYVGVFTLTIMMVVFVAHEIVVAVTTGLPGLGREWRDLWRSLVGLGSRGWIAVGGVLAALMAAMLLLMWPYLQVTRLYGSSRTFDEILGLLPRGTSYLLSDASWVWSGISRTVNGPPLRWEHQLFPGLIPILFACVGLVWIWRSSPKSLHLTMALGLLGMVAVTLAVEDHSLWYYLSKLPLFSALRAVARIMLGMLFLLAYLAGRGADVLAGQTRAWGRVAVGVLSILLVVECVAVSPSVKPLSQWEQANEATDARIPGGLPKDAILFLAQPPGNPYRADVNAMWAAIRAHRQTLNGYTGLLPDGFTPVYGNDCAELPRRVLSYLSFSHQGDDPAAYQALMARIVPIGFGDCDPSWRTTPPTLTASTSEFPQDKLKGLVLSAASVGVTDGWGWAQVRLTNTTSEVVAADGDHCVQVAVNTLDASGKPVEGGYGVMGLRVDLKPGASLALWWLTNTPKAPPGGSIQLGVIQKELRRASDVGVAPVIVPVQG